MSEPAPERPRSSGRENVFTRKLGPLPMWAWVAIVAAALILWAYWKNKQQARQQQTATTDASQVPQFVNQTFTTVIPPAAPPPPPDIDKQPPQLLPWKDESKKDKRIKTWEHKHPGQEYPFNTWLGNPTAAQLAAYNANPLFQPSFPQSTQWPVDMPPGQRWDTAPKVAQPQPVPGVENARQELGGTVSGKRLA